MKNTIYSLGILFNLFSCQIVHAQNFGWGKQIGGTESEESNYISVDFSGNVYTTGPFIGTSDFDPGVGNFNLTSEGGFDIFISKLNATGDLVWVKRIGGIDNDYTRSITTDASGNVYITGGFYGTVDFDPGLETFNLTSSTTVVNLEAYILKLDALGNFLWAKSIAESPWGSIGYSIHVDGSNNLYATGVFAATADFDPGQGTFNLTSNGDSDIFVIKLSATGNFEWARNMGGIKQDAGLGIATDASGNVYTAGIFDRTADFDPGAGVLNFNPGGARDIFISKLDASGNFKWAKQLGGTGIDQFKSIAVDASGNLHTTGFFNGLADFDPGTEVFNLTSGGAEDIFISKIDAAGNFVWAKHFSGTSSEGGYSIALDAIGNVYTVGSFWGSVDFDPGAGIFTLSVEGVEGDIFISKIDAAGNFVWARQMGGIENDRGFSIAIDPSGNVYTTGVFKATADFDPGAGTFNLTSQGNYGSFISKLEQAPTAISEVFQTNNLRVYPNPSETDLYIELLNYKNALAEIYTVEGKLMQQISLQSHKTILPVSQLTSGIYFMKISNSEGTITKRFIRKN